MSQKKKDPDENEESVKQVKKLMHQNKALALSFAVALALSTSLAPATLAATAMSSKTVLEKEKEGTAAEREWEAEEDQGYSYSSYGSGYYYRPAFWSGTSSRATWASAGSKKTSSVGGYHISKGSAAG